MIARAFDNESKRDLDLWRRVTQVLVNRNDPGFKNPTKGSAALPKDKADVRSGRLSSDAGRGRRMIASPCRLKRQVDAIKA
jgi:carbamate kinase